MAGDLHPAPRSGFGALFQLAETTLDWQEPKGDITLDDVLAGRVRWDDVLPCLVPEG